MSLLGWRCGGALLLKLKLKLNTIAAAASATASASTTSFLQNLIRHNSRCCLSFVNNPMSVHPQPVGVQRKSPSPSNGLLFPHNRLQAILQRKFAGFCAIPLPDPLFNFFLGVTSTEFFLELEKIKSSSSSTIMEPGIDEEPEIVCPEPPPGCDYGPWPKAPLAFKWVRVPSPKSRPSGTALIHYREQLVRMQPDQDMKFLREDLIFTTHSEEGTDSGVDTYFGLCTYPGHELQHCIDLKVYPRDIYAFGLIAWTGNDVLNRRLRLLAESKGFRLDDTGLFPATHGSGGKRITE
ncbi:hypothetical protein CMV_019619 [Castanea mollissima]|uniref:DNA polymerase beta thumb domain-containing protein n=1 Tax=Castanea mollissima TaxID=60419 RepID=A0A8J4QMT9_9ROSI|nr:hypothetical protein CMV_019619 [Castanea mollissima]